MRYVDEEQNENIVSGTTLRVDILTTDAQYLINNESMDYGGSFIVDNKQVASMMLFIKQAGKELGIPISRVYISGCCLTNKTNLCTKERIIERLINNIYPMCDENKTQSLKK